MSGMSCVDAPGAALGVGVGLALARGRGWRHPASGVTRLQSPPSAEEEGRHHPLAPSSEEEGGPVVPLRPRDDGWTPARQRAFLEALASCGSVAAAARRVGMSRESAYALRRRSDARGFAQAWDAARLLAAEHLVDLAWDRAVQGEVRPLVYHGEVVGEVRHYDNRLLLGLIAQNRKVLVEQGLADPPEVTAAVAADWDAALTRAEQG